VTRYGCATVPMEEARATAAVDLVRRPHAEVSLAFTGDRVGGLAVTLLPHGLDRFAMQAGLTMHVQAEGDDDHHVAEAAFKALGRALREACAQNGGSGSTKGTL
jgi:imidazoleglycerol-phosphate dehydratase/histidinol-phosphatase